MTGTEEKTSTGLSHFWLTAHPWQCGWNFVFLKYPTLASIRWEESDCCSGLVYIKIVFVICNIITMILISVIWGWPMWPISPLDTPPVTKMHQFWYSLKWHLHSPTFLCHKTWIHHIFITSWIQISSCVPHTPCFFTKFADSFAIQPPLTCHSLMRKASHGIPNPVLDF